MHIANADEDALDRAHPDVLIVRVLIIEGDSVLVSIISVVRSH
jgi:hypothetical protein